MPEVDQLNLGNEGMFNDPGHVDHNTPSQKRRSRSKRKHSSHHQSELSINDKKSRSSKSLSSHKSSRSSKKKERTNDEVHGQVDISSPQTIHSKLKRSRHRASSRGFGDGLLYSSHHRRRDRSLSSGSNSGEKRPIQSAESTESLTEYSSHSRKKPHRRSKHSSSHGSAKSLKSESSKKSEKKSKREDTMHSSSHGSAKSLEDESSKKSKRKDKRKSHHRQSSRERFDLIPTIPSRTTSMVEAGRRERITKRPRQHNEILEISMKSPAKQDSRKIRMSSHEQTLPRRRSTSSLRKSAPAMITYIDFEKYSRCSGSSEGRANAVTNGTTRYISRSSSERSHRHSTISGSDHESFRHSRRIPIIPRIADASIPSGPSSFSSVRDGIEKDVKQERASNPNPYSNNGRGRSPSPEESLDTRPGAQAVSLNGEEFRRALDSRLLAHRPPASAMSDQFDDHHESASTTTSLQATIVDEESHPGVEAIKAENQRVRKSMIAENQRRRQQIENHRHCHMAHRHHQSEDLSTVSLGEIVEATPAEENDRTAREEKKRKRRLLGALLCCLFFSVIGAIGGVFAPNLIAKFSSSKNVPTLSPTLSYYPSSPPTIAILYDQPTEEDCLAVENGKPVSDQDKMIVVTLDVGLEIILNKDIAQNEWMDQLLQSILAHLIPYLVGCTDDKDPTVPNRYIFGNGNATIDYDDAEVCEKETDLPCYPVAVHLDLTVKDAEEISALINLLEMLIGPADVSGDSLVNRLDLSDDFNEVVLDDITNASPTSVSSSSPTSMASSYPSAAPSSFLPSFPTLRAPTPRPSLVPVDMPTTDLPSSSPSTRPTLPPTPKPTPAVTIGSTPPLAPGPTKAQTPAPSNQPSYGPSSGPSPAPSTGPSPFPTSEPSFAPSSDPSSLPTEALTPAPTAATSSVPSEAPSFPPTIAPSLEPSENPSTAPSEFPSNAPVVWEFVANKSGNPAAIPSLDFQSLVQGSPNRIIRRICNNCVSSHQDIYYKRLTDLPAQNEYNGVPPANFLDVFLNHWYDTPQNNHTVDFELYSSYEDALAGQNQWKYCDFNIPSVGFPRDCGPTGSESSQWNSLSNPNSDKNFEFYVESL